MKFKPILVDDSLQELTQLGTEEFPISVNTLRVQDEGCFQVRHWHYEIQILVMIRGSAVFETPAGEYALQEGEGLFVNSGVLHAPTGTDDPESTYICTNFRPSLIESQENSLIYRDYVRSVLENPDIPSFALREEPWQQEILAALLEMDRINDGQAYGYEIALKMQLHRIWHLILIHHQSQVEKAAPVSFADRHRIQLLKQFIHMKYMEQITLQDIACAGHISPSECCRVFRRTEQMSPIQYLRRYRILQSTKYLNCTGLSITEISFQVGFESASYYIACFKREMSCTPLEYRTRYLQDHGGPPAP